MFFLCEFVFDILITNITDECDYSRLDYRERVVKTIVCPFKTQYVTLNGKIFKFKAGTSGGSVGCTASVLKRERETEIKWKWEMCVIEKKERDRETLKERKLYY